MPRRRRPLRWLDGLGAVQDHADEMTHEVAWFMDFLVAKLRRPPEPEGVRPAHVRAFLEALGKGSANRAKGRTLSPRAVARAGRVLAAFFDFLVSEGLLRESPARDLITTKTRGPRRDRKERRS